MGIINLFIYSIMKGFLRTHLRNINASGKGTEYEKRL